MRKLTLAWMTVGLVAALMPALNFLSLSAVMAAQGQDPADLVSQGDLLLLRSDFAAAEEAYNAALAADPECAAAYAHRCYLRTFQFLPDDAVADCQRAIALAPEDPEGYIYLIRAYDWCEKFDEAIEIGKQAIFLAPESGLAHSFLGEAYIGLGRFEEGEAELRLAAELAPNEPEVHRNLALLYLQLGQTEDLFNELAIAQSLAPDFVNYPLETAQFYYGLGQYEAALGYFQQALAIVQETGDRAGEGVSLGYIGFIYASLGQYEQALDYHQQALAISQEIGDRAGEGISLHNIGFTYHSLGQYEEALEYFQQALSIQQEIGDRRGEGVTLHNIGSACSKLRQYEQALDYYHQALLIRQEIGDRSGQGHSLHSIGFAYAELWQHELALEHYQQALSVQQQIGDRAGEAVTLHNIGLTYHRQGQYEEALEYYRQALVIWQEIGDRAGEGTSLNAIGGIYDKLGQYEEALDYFQQGLTIRQEINDRAGEGISLNNIGCIYDCLGQYDQALEYHQRALSIQQEINDREGEGATLLGIGFSHLSLGQYKQALEYYQQALAIQQEIGDQEGEGASLNNIGDTYDRLGQHEQALECYQQALAIQQEIGDREGQGVTLHNIGVTYYSLRQYDWALETCQEALGILQEIDNRAGEGGILQTIGAIYDTLGQYEQALEYYQQALAIQQEIGDRAGEGVTLNNIGFIYDSLGKYEQVLKYYQQALSIRQQIGDREGEWVTLHNIGTIYCGLGQYEQALIYYRQAIEVIESLQGEVKVEELKASLAGEQKHTYRLLIGLLQVEGHPEEGFAYAERARARAFLDQMGNQRVDLRQSAAPELTEQEQELRQRLLGLQNALTAERAKPFDQQSQELLERLGAELEGARRDHEQLLTRLKLASPEYASLVSVSTLTLEQVQEQVLDQDTTLIEYFVLDDQVLAWVIDQQGFELVALVISRDELHNRVGFLQDLIASQDFDAEVAANLYDALFAPLKPHIRHANLVIVPHGVLHYLPFAALWDAENERYLVQDYALTYAPSASVLQFILDKRNPEDGRLLALGNPDGSLPYSEGEAQAIARLYDALPLLGEEATEGQVHAQAGQVDLMHLAAHGVYNSVNPMYTCIELAPDDAQDGNLEVHEVFGLDLTGANLVVLSACQTALGEQSEGDELVGLTRAFLYAGTPAVVTTLWSIDDAASGALMESFYGYLRDGMTNAEALRAAQLAVMEEEGWEEPYYWAAFSLTGDYLGSGEPAMVLADTPEPTQAASAVRTPTNVPAVEPSPAPGAGRRGLCASAAMPLGLVLLVGIQHRRMRRRNGS